MKNSLLGIAIAAALLAMPLPAAHAGPITYNVTLDTTALTNNPAQGPFAVDFQLNDGSGLNGDGNNTATISNFALSSGGSLDAVNPLGIAGGGASGTLSGNNLAITDSSFLNDFNQAFTPGTSSPSMLSFTLTLTTNFSAAEQANAPDQFSFTVYSNLNDTTPSQASFFTFDINGPNPTLTRSGGTLGNGVQVPKPVVEPEVAVPEPASLTLFVFGLGTLAARRGWQRRKITA